MSERAIVVLSTFPSEDTAALAARTLVEEQLAACVNLVPAVRYDGLAERLAALHPYDVPEILALPVETGAAAYLRWLAG